MRIRFIPIMLLALLILGGTAAYAASGNDNARDKGATELTLYGTEIANTYITATGEVVDGDGDGEILPTAGDRFLLVDELYADEERTEAVGHNDIECTVTWFTGTSEEDFEQHLLCQGVVTIHDSGTLAWQAAMEFQAGAEFDPEAPFATVAITGGTGDFLAAAGMAGIFDTGAGETETTSRYEVTLVGKHHRG